MIKKPESASPVTSPRTSAPLNVFNTVRSAVGDRLQHTVQNHNSTNNLIAGSRAAKPEVAVSNEMVASVLDFQPRQGTFPRQSMHLQVHNNPGQRVDAVADAIQRYLNIRPRREPTSDPQDEASIARHPQQILQKAQRWDEARLYQFSINGQRSTQFLPEMHRWGGTLDASIEEPGLTGLAAPATRAPRPGRSPVSISHDPVFAAQAAMSDISERQQRVGPEQPIVSFGPPNMTSDPYFSPAFAAQNAMGRVRDLMKQTDGHIVSVGASALTDRPTHDPTTAWAATLQNTRENLAIDDPTIITAGAGGYSDRAYNDPAFAYSNAINRTASNLNETFRLPIVKVGAGGYSERPTNDPTVAGEATIAKLVQTYDQPSRLPIVEVGAGGYSDNPKNDPAIASEATMAVTREILNPPELNLPPVRPVNWSERPGNHPSVALQASMNRTHENMTEGIITDPGFFDKFDDPTFAYQRAIARSTANLNGPEEKEIISVGSGDLFNSIHKKPEQAWISATQSAINLLKEPGGKLEQSRSGSQEQAYIRAMKIMRSQENFMLATQAIGAVA